MGEKRKSNLLGTQIQSLELTTFWVDPKSSERKHLDDREHVIFLFYPSDLTEESHTW